MYCTRLVGCACDGAEELYVGCCISGSR
jgi:hypothetical protein